MKIFYLIPLLLLYLTLQADENISIQLKWKHGFQFAGYYAAVEKGFFKDEGLNVTLKEIDFHKNFIDAVVDGDSEYGVSDSSLVVSSLNKKPVILVAQIFQHSPLVLLSHRDSNILTPYDLVGKKVMYAFKSTGGTPFNALILKTIGDLKKVHIRYFTNYQDFIEKKVDVTSAYSTSQPYWLKKQGVEVNIIDPKSYGIDFYGDNLFTTKKELKEHPYRVQKVKRAVLKGWNYALSHQDEMIEIILKKYAPKKAKDELEFEAKGIYQMIMPDFTDLGAYDKNRYKQVVRSYYQLGLISDTKIDDSFFYQDKYMTNLTQEERDWLKKHKKITFTGDPKWLPFEAFDEKGNYTGIVADFLKEIEKKLDVKFQKRVVKSWQETLELSKEKKVDVISGDIDDIVLKQNYTPIKPYLKTPIVIVMRKDSGFVDDIDEIEDKRIAVIRGYGYVSALKNYYKQKSFIEIENVKKALEMLSLKKVDAVLLALPTAVYSIKTLGFADLKVVGKTKIEMQPTLFVIKSKPVLKSILEKTLSTVTKKRSHDILQRWQSIEFAKEVDYRTLFVVVSVFLLILAVSMFWNRKLSVEIDRRKKVEEELKKAKQQAELANISKSEFLANMSHEIRTPMNSVIGFSQLLQNLIKDPVQKDYLTSIINGGKALLRIIDDILDLSKIEAGKLSITLESVDIRKLVFEIESIFSVKLMQKNLHYKVEIDDNIPQYLLLDGTRVRQILFNLVGNAIKFTDSGEIKLSVNLLKHDIQNSKVDIELIVQDSGIGIKEENLESIFGTFEQQRDQDKKYGGTGLGLAICKKLSIMMGGDIKVKSKVGVGSEFVVTLKDIAITSPEYKDKDELVSKEVEFQKATIMIADDVMDNIKLVSSMLEEYGFEIVFATDGKDAVDKLQSIKVDLVFMDLKMPVMDGYEATKLIKESKKTKHIPVVALTASVLQRDQQKIKEYNFDGYIRKPVAKDDVVRELKKFIMHRVLEKRDDFKEEETSINDIEKVVKELEDKVYKRWEEIKEMGDFALIEEFAVLLEELAKQNNINKLYAYAKELKIHSESFDIERVELMLNSYPDMIEKIKEYYGVK